MVTNSQFAKDKAEKELACMTSEVEERKKLYKH